MDHTDHSSDPTATVINVKLAVFESVTLATLIWTCYHMATRALKNKTGPKRSGARVKNYSGVHEGDVVAVLINLIMSVAYFGGLMETLADEHHGFFHTYKYAPYCFTCPLIMFDLAYSTGGLYRIPIAVLTWVDLLIALFADLAPKPWKWAWFGYGSIIYVVMIYFMLAIFRRAWKICTSLSKPTSRRLNVAGDKPEEEEDAEMNRKQCQKMKKARIYITIALILLFIVWPMFPIVFVLEHTDVISLESTIMFFCCLDIFAKAFHTLMVEKYREIMLDRLSTYGFLTPDVLRKIDADGDVAEQLHDMAEARKKKHTLAWKKPRRRISVQEMSQSSRSSLNRMEVPETPSNNSASVTPAPANLRRPNAVLYGPRDTGRVTREEFAVADEIYAPVSNSYSDLSVWEQLSLKPLSRERDDLSDGGRSEAPSEVGSETPLTSGLMIV